MTDREILLEAVVSRPDEDVPRLAFADYLDEVGEREQAEFIRVQLDLANGATTPGPCPTCNGLGIYDKVVGGGDPVKHRGSARGFTGRRVTTYRTMEKKTEATLCEACNASGVIHDQKWLRKREMELRNGVLENSRQLDWFPGWRDWYLTTHRRFFLGGHRVSVGLVRRGFVEAIRISWRDFRLLHRGVMWWPGAKDPCANSCVAVALARRIFNPNAPTHSNLWTECTACDKGWMPRPSPEPSAQPIREVYLTTWPNGEVRPDRNSFFTFQLDVLFTREKCKCSGYLHACPTCDGKPLNRWSTDLWGPDVTFIMPELRGHSEEGDDRS